MKKQRTCDLHMLFEWYVTSCYHSRQRLATIQKSGRGEVESFESLLIGGWWWQLPSIPLRFEGLFWAGWLLWGGPGAVRMKGLLMICPWSFDNYMIQYDYIYINDITYITIPSSYLHYLHLTSFACVSFFGSLALWRGVEATELTELRLNVQVDPCHLYDKPAVDCILSDWETWGECDVSWTSQTRRQTRHGPDKD